MVIASVALLDFHNRPNTILWGVTDCAVPTFDCVIPRRSRSHVGVECQEIAPAVANLDAFTPIVFPVLAVGIVATIADTPLDSVFWGAAAVVSGMSVYSPHVALRF